MTMHSSLIIAAVGLALWLRWQWQPTPQAPWQQRWHQALVAFCLPPLLLLSMAVAVLCMGHHGTMLGLPVSQAGCWVATGVLLTGLGWLGYLAGQGVRSHLHLRRYPQVDLETGDTARCLPTELPYAAQVGFWRSQLLVSQGLITHLTAVELEAVLAHEEAHKHYRDTFWFFWLGWLRRLSCWLPNTDALWQELLLLRELRADRLAATQVDPLLLAEMLVKLVAFPAKPELFGQAAFSQPLSASRLEQRIEALLAEPQPSSAPGIAMPWILVSLVPLGTVLLHS
jgi:Zn-dependent protease with chaperone function